MGVLDHASNRDLLDYLRTNARPGTGRRGAEFDGWELHTHPDLIERLAEIAGSPRAVIPVYGVAAIAHKGVAAVVALGYRHPAVPPTDAPDGR